jgi:hypothetical protein
MGYLPVRPTRARKEFRMPRVVLFLVLLLVPAPAVRAAAATGPTTAPTSIPAAQVQTVKSLLQPASDAEWAKLEPAVVKLLSAQANVRTLVPPRGGRAAAGPVPAVPGADPAVTRLFNDLQAAMDDPQISEADMAARLAAFRDARDKARRDLAEAQKQLQELLTPRQLAAMVAAGYLE